MPESLYITSAGGGAVGGTLQSPATVTSSSTVRVPLTSSGRIARALSRSTSSPDSS